MSDLTFREARASELEALYALGEQAWDHSRADRGLIGEEEVRTGHALLDDWGHERPLIEMMTAQEGACFLVAEEDGELAGYVIATRFAGMDEMVDLWARPGLAGQGVSRGLLERCWADSPTPDLGRLVVAVGTPADLTLFTEFGVMPVSGHWHMLHRVDQYLEQRAHEVDSREPGVHVLTPTARSRSGSGSSRARSATIAPRSTSSSRERATASPRWTTPGTPRRCAG